MLGFVGRTSSGSAISSRGTALALLYFGFDKFVLAPRREAAMLVSVLHESRSKPTVAPAAQSIAVFKQQ